MCNSIEEKEITGNILPTSNTNDASNCPLT